MKKLTRSKLIFVAVLLIAAMAAGFAFNTPDYGIASAAAEAAAPDGAVPENGLELYDLADFWLGCHVNINADHTFTVAFDYSADASGIVCMAGAWEQVSGTELSLKPENGDPIPVTLADGVWSCEVTEPNTYTVCHPKAETGAAEEPAAAAAPEAGMELYELADFWLGCHVNINADGTFTVAFDYSADYAGVVTAAGTWERLSDTELVLRPDSGEDIPVVLADGAWSCEVQDPNTQTVCHPVLAAGEPAAAAESASRETMTYTVQYMDADGTVFATVETADASALPEVEIPEKEGFRFAGWQTRPDVTRGDLVLGVSPYEMTSGASSLYGGAGMAIDSLESTEGTTVTVYARWVEPVYIHSAEELQAMAEDLYGWYILAEDIDLSGAQWIPVGMYFSNYETVNAAYWTYAFHGMLDGAGHKLTGLAIGNYVADVSAMETAGAVWRNDGTYSGSEAALFGAIAKADIRNLVIENPVVTVESDTDATPYAAPVAGFDIGSMLTNITVTDPVVTVTVSDQNTRSRASAWAAASGLVAGGWSDTITGCTVTGARITLQGRTVRSHGGEFYVGSMLGEGYAFMDGNSADYELNVDIEDGSAALTDEELIVNVGGMGGTNTTQTNGIFIGTMNVRVVKPAGKSTVSIGGLTGSQRYQVAENNTVKAEITADCRLDPDQGRLYAGSVIGSTNVPYCIVQLIFAAPGDVAFSGCRNNTADVLLNGEPVTAAKGETLSVNGEALRYIANGDLTDGSTGETYVSNISDVIAEYGSAVPASFLQNAVIVLVDEQ